MLSRRILWVFSLKVMVSPTETEADATSSFFAVDHDVAVGDELSGGPDRADDAEAADDVIEAGLEELEQGDGGVALGFFGEGHVAAELFFHDGVMGLDALLFAEAHAVFRKAIAAERVHPGGDKLGFVVFGEIGDCDAETTGEADLRSSVTTHENSCGKRRARG